MLASEQQIRRDLTLEKLKLELASNPAVKRISLPLPKEWYTEGEASRCTAYPPVPVHANIDGVDMKFDASVVIDVFPVIEARQDYLLPTHVANIPSRMTYALDETVEQAMVSAPTVVRQAALAIKDLDTELYEDANTVHGIKDLLLVQNRDVHVLAIKKLVAQESFDHDIFPDDVRACVRT